MSNSGKNQFCCTFEFGDCFRRAGGDVELFLRKEDLVFSDDLKAIFKNGCVVTESDDIVYGGLRAADRKTHCLADDTLDTKLKEQKEWFLEHSGLSIEE